MIPLKTVEELISKHSLLEKDLSSGKIDKKFFAEKSKEYADLNEIIQDAKKYILYEKNRLEIQKIIDDKNSDTELIKMAETELNDLKLENENKEKKLKLFSLKTWTSFAKKVNSHKKKLNEYLKKLKNNKYNISAYGASGKGQALLQICDIGSNFLDNIYDKSILKQGKYTPGTHIKIIDPKYINAKKTNYLLLLSWNLAKEIAKQEKKFLKNNGKLIIPFPSPRIFK